jgi:hypothetical protein
MKRYLSLAVFSCGILVAVDAIAMPLAPVHLKPPAIPVASGCGLGVHRGSFNGCYPIYPAYAGYFSGYRNAYYVGPVSGGVCGGRGTHLACDYYGFCWVACN